VNDLAAAAVPALGRRRGVNATSALFAIDT